MAILLGPRPAVTFRSLKLLLSSSFALLGAGVAAGSKAPILPPPVPPATQFTAGFGTLVKLTHAIEMRSSDQAVVGNFDGDRKTDYARLDNKIANFFRSTAVPSYGQKPFDYPFNLDFGLSFPIPSWPAITGDFNGDRKTDLIRLGGTGAWLFFATSSFPNTTTGFQSYEGLDFGEVSMWQNVTGDFDGDRKADYGRLGATGAWFFYGKGNATFTRVFQDYEDLDFGLSRQWDVVAGDFNGDGRTDYARLGDTGAWLYFGKSTKSFTRGFQSYDDLAFGFGTPPFFVPTWKTISGDFNGDSRWDYGRLGSTGAWFYFGKSNGSFTRQFHDYGGLEFGVETPGSPWQTIVGDFNGDHKMDYGRLGVTGAFFYYATGSRSFSPLFQEYPESFLGLPLINITGDFNGDGRADYARLGDQVEWRFIHD